MLKGLGLENPKFKACQRKLKAYLDNSWNLNKITRIEQGTCLISRALIWQAWDSSFKEASEDRVSGQYPCVHRKTECLCKGVRRVDLGMCKKR